MVGLILGRLSPKLASEPVLLIRLRTARLSSTFELRRCDRTRDGFWRCSVAEWRKVDTSTG